MNPPDSSTEGPQGGQQRQGERADVARGVREGGRTEVAFWVHLDLPVGREVTATLGPRLGPWTLDCANRLPLVCGEGGGWRSPRGEGVEAWAGVRAA